MAERLSCNLVTISQVTIKTCVFIGGQRPHGRIPPSDVDCNKLLSIFFLLLQCVARRQVKWINSHFYKYINANRIRGTRRPKQKEKTRKNAKTKRTELTDALARPPGCGGTQTTSKTMKAEEEKAFMFREVYRCTTSVSLVQGTGYTCRT